MIFRPAITDQSYSPSNRDWCAASQSASVRPLSAPRPIALELSHGHSDRAQPLAQIPVLLHDSCVLDLKVAFGQFCLEEHLSELHVHFHPLYKTADQRHARHESELRNLSQSLFPKAG